MVVYMEKVNIERYNIPDNKTLHQHIKSITKTKIRKLITDFIPREGEIIKYGSTNYIVVKTIRIIDWQSEIIEERHEKFVIQVDEYCPEQIMTSGSDSWKENIPLCIDIEGKIEL